MRLIDRLFTPRAIDASTFNLAQDIWPSKSDAGIMVDTSSAMSLVSVYACVTLISDAISSLPVDLLRKQGERRVEVDRRPAWLEYPNQQQSWREFTNLTLHSLLTHGNAFVLITARDAQQYPQSLELIHPNEIQVREERGRKVIFHSQTGQVLSPYTARTPNGEVLHLMGHSADGLVGLSPVDQARQAIGGGLAMEKFGNKFFGQGSTVSGVIEMPPGSNPTPDQLEGLSAQWRRKHSGIENAWKPVVLANGASFKPISLPLDQAQFIESKKFSVAEIARLYRVPPHLIGDVERSTSWGTGIEQQGIAFVQYTLSPWITRLEDAFGQLTPRGQYLRYNVNALLRGDQKARMDAYAVGIQNGFLTRNEARALEDLEPIDGLDEPLAPLNMTSGSDPTPAT